MKALLAMVGIGNINKNKSNFFAVPSQDCIKRWKEPSCTNPLPQRSALGHYDTSSTITGWESSRPRSTTSPGHGWKVSLNSIGTFTNDLFMCFDRGTFWAHLIIPPNDGKAALLLQVQFKFPKMRPVYLSHERRSSFWRRSSSKKWCALKP